MTDDEEPPMDEADTSALQTPSGEKIKEPGTKYRSQAASVPGQGSTVQDQDPDPDPQTGSQEFRIGIRSHWCRIRNTGS